MATEEAGLELNVEGEDDFSSALEKANAALASLNEAAATIADTLAESSEAFDTADEAMTGLGEGAQESAEGIDNSAESLDDADEALVQFSDSADEAGSSFDVASEIIIGGLRKIGEIAVESFLSAGAAFGDFVADSFAGALDAEKVMARLNAQIKAQGSSAAVTAEQAGELADQYKHLAGGSDDAILSAEAVLLKFNQISGETFPQTIKVSADLAALMGTDVASAAQTLGFALETGGDGLARIAKQTGAFTDEELKNIKAMQEAGDIAGAQKAILNNLEDAIGGTADALANTTAGQWQIFQETISDTGEGLAAMLLPTLLDLSQSVLPLVVGAVTEFANSIGNVITLLATGDFSGGIFGLSEDDPYITALISLRDNALQLYAVAQMVFTQLPEIVDSASVSITAAFNEIVIWAQPIIAAALNVQAAFEESMPAIQGAVDVALKFIQNLWNVVFPSIQATTSNTLTQIATLTANILNAVAEFWRVHGTTILTGVTLFMEAVSAIIAATLAIISGTVSVTLSIINGDWDAAGAALQSSTTAFMNAVLSIVGMNLDKFLAVWRGVLDQLGIIIHQSFANFVVFIADGINNAINAAQAIAEGFYKIGRAIVDGMIKGVVSAAVGLVNAVRNAVSDAIYGGQDEADSHSPSERTRKVIGQPLGQGMEEGVKDTAGDFESALLVSVQSAIDSIAPDLGAFSRMFSDSIAPPSSASQIAQQSVYNNSSSNSITINAQYPMQSARSVSDDLQMWTMLTGNSAA